MVIQHDISLLNGQRHLAANRADIGKRLEKLSSGYRVNRAADDAAGLAISEKMRSQVRGLTTARMNADHGASLVNTAEGGCAEIHNILQRMRALAVQSSNGVYTGEDRGKLQSEYSALQEEIDRIANATHFNGIYMLNGRATSTTVQGSSISTPGTVVVEDYLPITLEKLVNWLENSNPDIYRENLIDLESTSGNYAAGSINAIQENLNEWFGIDSYLTWEQIGGAPNASALAMSLFIEANGSSSPNVYLVAAGDDPIVQGIYDNATGKYVFNFTSYGHNTTMTVAFGNASGVNARLPAGYRSGILFALNASAPPPYLGYMYVHSHDGYNANDPIAGDGSHTYDFGQILLLKEPETLPGDSDTVTWLVTKEDPIILQVGTDDKDSHRLYVNRADLRTSNLGLSDRKINETFVGSLEDANRALAVIDAAIGHVSGVRAYFGATQNRLGHITQNLGVSIENMTASESAIRDDDMAKEMMGFVKQDILTQASQALLAQMQDLSSQRVLSLLQ